MKLFKEWNDYATETISGPLHVVGEDRIRPHIDGGPNGGAPKFRCEC